MTKLKYFLELKPSHQLIMMAAHHSCFRLAQLISIFISVWLTAAGIIHLV